MINTRFEAYKLKRLLKQSGSKFTFVREKLNEFNEPNGEPEEVATLTGIYHETNSFMTDTVGDAATTRTKKQPMIICLYDDFVSSSLCQGDKVFTHPGTTEMPSKTLKYVGCVDIQNWGIIADLSFEEVDDGGDSQIEDRVPKVGT